MFSERIPGAWHRGCKKRNETVRLRRVYTAPRCTVFRPLIWSYRCCRSRWRLWILKSFTQSDDPAKRQNKNSGLNIRGLHRFGPFRFPVSLFFFSRQFLEFFPEIRVVPNPSIDFDDALLYTSSPWFIKIEFTEVYGSWISIHSLSSITLQNYRKHTSRNEKCITFQITYWTLVSYIVLRISSTCVFREFQKHKKKQLSTQ